MPAGELPVAGTEFDDGQLGSIGRRDTRAALSQPFGDQTIELESASLGAMRAQIAILAGDRNYGLTGRAMLPVLGDSVRKTWHGAVLRFDRDHKTVITVLALVTGRTANRWQVIRSALFGSTYFKSG